MPSDLILLVDDEPPIIQLARMYLERDGFRVEAVGDGKAALETVASSGAGIPSAAILHIFERFYQADPSCLGGEKHGAGLGLAIVHEIVAAHGGRITVRSQEGLGTTFTIHLPLVQPAATTLLRRKK
jgi:signal transduction histidine kinase